MIDAMKKLRNEGWERAGMDLHLRTVLEQPVRLESN